MSTLRRQGKGTAIRQREIEDLLIMKLGATQQTTLNRHLDIMVRLGWLRLARGGTAFRSAEFDLIGTKLGEIKFRQKAPELEEKPRRGRPRR